MAQCLEREERLCQLCMFVCLFVVLGLNEGQVPSLESLLCVFLFNLASDSQMGASQGIGPSPKTSPSSMKCVFEKDSYLSDCGDNKINKYNG